MFVNIFWVRIAFIGLSMVAVLGFLVAGGGFGGKASIVIEYGMEPDLFEGCPVEIDGEVAGGLERFGNATRTAFAVDEGRHTVRLIHPEFASEPVTVNSGAGARTVHLVVDFLGTDEEGKTLIGFQY